MVDVPAIQAGEGGSNPTPALHLSSPRPEITMSAEELLELPKRGGRHLWIDGRSAVRIRRFDGEPVDPEIKEKIYQMVQRLLPEMKKRDIKISGGTARFVIVATPEIESGQFRVEVGEPLPDPAWWDTFLDWLRQGKTVGLAAELAGVSRISAYRHRRAHPEFRRRWAEAIGSAHQLSRPK